MVCENAKLHGSIWGWNAQIASAEFPSYCEVETALSQWAGGKNGVQYLLQGFSWQHNKIAGNQGAEGMCWNQRSQQLHSGRCKRGNQTLQAEYLHQQSTQWIKNKIKYGQNKENGTGNLREQNTKAMTSTDQWPKSAIPDILVMYAKDSSTIYCTDYNEMRDLKFKACTCHTAEVNGNFKCFGCILEVAETYFDYKIHRVWYQLHTLGGVTGFVESCKSVECHRSNAILTSVTAKKEATSGWFRR